MHVQIAPTATHITTRVHPPCACPKGHELSRPLSLWCHQAVRIELGRVHITCGSTQRHITSVTSKWLLVNLQDSKFPGRLALWPSKLDTPLRHNPNPMCQTHTRHASVHQDLDSAMHTPPTGGTCLSLPAWVMCSQLPEWQQEGLVVRHLVVTQVELLCGHTHHCTHNRVTPQRLPAGQNREDRSQQQSHVGIMASEALSAELINTHVMC